jgi:hypothetical protein
MRRLVAKVFGHRIEEADWNARRIAAFPSLDQLLTADAVDRLLAEPTDGEARDGAA